MDKCTNGRKKDRSTCCVFQPANAACACVHMVKNIENRLKIIKKLKPVFCIMFTREELKKEEDEEAIKCDFFLRTFTPQVFWDCAKESLRTGLTYTHPSLHPSAIFPPEMFFVLFCFNFLCFLSFLPVEHRTCNRVL